MQTAGSNAFRLLRRTLAEGGSLFVSSTAALPQSC